MPLTGLQRLLSSARMHLRRRQARRTAHMLPVALSRHAPARFVLMHGSNLDQGLHLHPNTSQIPSPARSNGTNWCWLTETATAPMRGPDEMGAVTPAGKEASVIC